MGTQNLNGYAVIIMWVSNTAEGHGQLPLILTKINNSTYMQLFAVKYYDNNLQLHLVTRNRFCRGKAKNYLTDVTQIGSEIICFYGNAQDSSWIHTVCGFVVTESKIPDDISVLLQNL